jgi:hypothetical protein
MVAAFETTSQPFGCARFLLGCAPFARLNCPTVLVELKESNPTRLGNRGSSQAGPDVTYNNIPQHKHTLIGLNN